MHLSGVDVDGLIAIDRHLPLLFQPHIFFGAVLATEPTNRTKRFLFLAAVSLALLLLKHSSVQIKLGRDVTKPQD
jgi:hypothetical protein